MRCMEHVLGQSRAIDTLRSAVALGRVHHAWVFQGPAGVGKFTTAVAFAELLLCREPVRDLSGRTAACGSCVSCGAMRRSAHADLHVVTKELARYSEDKQTRERKLTTIPVEVLREALLGPVTIHARLGHGKVFIVDEAELITEHGQNLLLKTLEEPPVGTHIILVTSQPQRLLPTVRSRCQPVAFEPLSEQAMSQWLRRQTSHPAEAARDRWLIAFADGSPGLAATAMKFDLWSWAQRLVPAVDQLAAGKFDAALGGEMRQMIEDFAEAAIQDDDQASKDAANRRAASMMWMMIACHVRKRLGEALTPTPRGDIARQEAAAGPWLAIIDALREAELNVAANVNLGLVCDHLVSRMARAGETADIGSQCEIDSTH